MGKKIAIGLAAVVGVLVVLIGGGAIFLASNLDNIIETLVEEYGSEATGTEVALGSVDLDLGQGTVAFANLSVANPKGFKTDHAVTLSNISVTLDTAKTTDKLIVIKEIVIDEPVVTYEQVGSGSNLDEIKSNVGGGTSEATGDYTGPKIIIEALKFTGGKVHVSADGILDEDLATELPAFTLRDLGAAQGGATPDEIAAEVTKGLTGEAMNAVAQKGTETIMEKVLDGAGDTVNDIREGIGGLFNRNKDEDKDD